MQRQFRFLQGINSESVDLIYLDPPFNKNKTFTAPIGSSAEGASFKDYFRERVLKDTGSIYFHCDSTMSHYIKIMLDCVFGEKNFRNEIIWGYRTQGISMNW